MSTISAVQFPGTLSMTDENFSGYEAYDIKDSSFAILENLNFYNTTLNRAGTTPTVNSNITYYIQVTTDINKDISFSTVPVGANNTFDDVWSLSGLSFNDGISHIIDVSYNLPQINDVHVNVTKVHAYMSNDLSANSTFEYKYSGEAEYRSSSDASGAHLGRIVDLDIVFSSTSIGQFLTETKYYDYSGSGFEVRVPEKIDFAQVVDIGDFGPYIKDAAAPTDTSTDVLTRNISASILNNISSGDVYVKRTAINSLYNYNYIYKSWSISITAQDAASQAADTYTPITHYARYNDWTTTDYGFYAGDRIVASNSHSLSLDMLDSSNNTISLITGTIYGVIRQDVSGART